MLADAELMAFVPATDLDRAKAFYVDKLGLELVERTPFACVVNSNGTMLRVTLVEHFEPNPFTVAGWAVNDILAAAAQLSTAGIEFLHFDVLEQDDLGIWTAPGGALVAWFKDSEGNTLSVGQAEPTA
jgi:catechol 2,3-dioxygenase-like lactoylglutathione lyase family enzyme